MIHHLEFRSVQLEQNKRCCLKQSQSPFYCSDLQKHQLYQQFGVDGGLGFNYSSPAQGYAQTSNGNHGMAHRYQGKSVMVQILSTIGLLSSFMVLAFIG